MKVTKDSKIYNNLPHPSREITLKRQLIEATDAVRKKFNSIKNKDMEMHVTLEKIYQPITEPLNVISSAAENKPHTKQPSTSRVSTQRTMSWESASEGASDKYVGGDDDQPFIPIMETPPSSIITTPVSETSLTRKLEKGYDVVKKHIQNLKSGDSKYDNLYGVRVDPKTDKLLMGNAEIRFSHGNITLWYGNKKLGVYLGSPELYDLIFLKRPPILDDNSLEGVLDKEWCKIYGEILRKTKAPYKKFNVASGYNTSRRDKFRKIIKPLTSSTIETRSSTSGYGLKRIPTHKLYRNKNKEFIYWNKPNELVDRLRLLWSSKMAGNNNHDNEIIEIISELREEKIVY